MTSIDRVATKDLTSRYNIGRTALYERFKYANVKPRKEGTRSWVSAQELEELDRLNGHLASGGKLEDFIPTLGKPSRVRSANNSANKLLAVKSSNEQSETIQLVNALAAIAIAQHEPLKYHKELKLACDEGWLLSTNDVYQLIGVKPKGSVFQRGSWEFVRRGKIGSQAAWGVVRLL